MPHPLPSPQAPHLLAGFAMGFGLLTILSGGRALFAGADMGQIVPFVLWFNFLAGFAYVAAGLALWRGLSWGLPLAVVIAVATALVFAAFGWHVAQGGPYEMRTVWAMTLRTGFWVVAALWLMRRAKT